MKITTSIILLFLLVGCGSDGSSSDGQLETLSTQTIEGLRYKVNNKTTTTNESGVLSCSENEEISVYAGAIFLSTLACKENLDIFDLANTKVPMNMMDYKKGIADKSMNRLLNLASFLQSIDEDGNPSNGIVIPKEFESISKDIKLDFSDEYYSFKSAFNFRKLMYLGRKNNIWEENRKIVKPYVALDRLYKVMHLKPEIYALDSRHYKYTHNESNGNIILTKINENSTFTYDDLGERSVALFDKNNNGRIDFKNEYTYDKDGNRIDINEYINDTIPIYFDNNGRAVYDYRDDNGSLTLYKKREQSYNYDGNLKEYKFLDMKYHIFVDTNTNYKYDKYGNNILKKVQVNPYESYCYITKYNALGQKVLYELDVDCDKTIEQRTTFKYDQKNRNIATQTDYDANGIIDNNETIIYMEDGGRRSLSLIYDNNGNVDMNLSNVIDANENLLSSDFESTFMNESHTKYEYSKTGKMLLENTYNTDGELTYVSSYKYDTHDNLLLSETKNIVENKIVDKSIYTYDEKNYPLTSSHRGDGSYDYDEVYTYDVHGNKLSYIKTVMENKDVSKSESSYGYINTGKWVSLISYGEERDTNY